MRETVLRHNLRAIRLAIDDYRADHGVNPEGLEKLVSGIPARVAAGPTDGQRDSWKTQAAERGGRGGREGGAGQGLDGSNCGSAPARASGLAYLGVLMLAAAIAAGLAATARPWSMQQQRARGRAAVHRPAVPARDRILLPGRPVAGVSNPSTPCSRTAACRSCCGICAACRDPLTGSADWGVVKGPDGGVIGVYSQAPGKPLKQDGFPPAGDFAGKAATRTGSSCDERR